MGVRNGKQDKMKMEEKTWNQIDSKALEEIEDGNQSTIEDAIKGRKKQHEKNLKVD
jgi:hypothetical protein